MTISVYTLFIHDLVFENLVGFCTFSEDHCTTHILESEMCNVYQQRFFPLFPFPSIFMSKHSVPREIPAFKLNCIANALI